MAQGTGLKDRSFFVVWRDETLGRQRNTPVASPRAAANPQPGSQSSNVEWSEAEITS
jgi:hypothetical protein